MNVKIYEKMSRYPTEIHREKVGKKQNEISLVSKLRFLYVTDFFVSVTESIEC